MSMLFNVHLVCVRVQVMCDVPGLYSCARGNGLICFCNSCVLTRCGSWRLLRRWQKLQDSPILVVRLISHLFQLVHSYDSPSVKNPRPAYQQADHGLTTRQQHGVCIPVRRGVRGEEILSFNFMNMNIMNIMNMMNVLFNVHLVCVRVRVMCYVPGLYSCARGMDFSNYENINC